MYLTIKLVSASPESMITTGTPLSTACLTLLTIVLLFCGASTRPFTPAATWRSMIAICSSALLSLSGPCQTTSTVNPCCCFRSAGARLAPGWIDCQNSCVIPLGMTATRYLASDLDVGQPVRARQASTARPGQSRRMMTFSLGDGGGSCVTGE